MDIKGLKCYEWEISYKTSVVTVKERQRTDILHVSMDNMWLMTDALGLGGVM